MKKLFALVLILGGMILLNSPPVYADQVVDEITCVSQLEQHSLDFSLEMYNLKTWTGLEDGVLKYPESSWSATILRNNLNQVVLQNARDKLIYSTWHSLSTTSDPERPETNSWQHQNSKKGLFRLSVGDNQVIQHIWETYI